MERGRHLRWRHHADSNADADTHPDADAGANPDTDSNADTDANRRHLRAGVGSRYGLQRGRHRQPCGHELPRQLLDAGRQPIDQQRRCRHGQAVDQLGNLQHHADSYPDTDANTDANTDADTDADADTYSNADSYPNANADRPRSRLLFCAMGRVWPRL